MACLVLCGVPSYTVFPLLLLLDAAVQCRKEANASGELDISDAIAEGGLACLEVLLTKCRLTSVNQVLHFFFSASVYLMIL
jgi:hypothetical protein